MKKGILNYNSKGYHGYQEGYYVNKLSYRTTYKNNEQVGYSEWHGMEQTFFYIS